jgi:hypothetical protein
LAKIIEKSPVGEDTASVVAATPAAGSVAVPAPESSRAVAVSDFDSEMLEHAGAGISGRQEDFLLPFLAVAQSNSPQLKKQQADAYIAGLKVGDIFDTATRKFWDGETGVVVVPAYFHKAEVEWVTRKNGGGYVATHAADTPLRAEVRIDPSDKRTRLLRSGHQLVETNYHFVVLVETCTPAVVALTSTGLQTSRQWNTQMSAVKIRRPDGALATAPCFGRAYRLRTTYRQNDQGDWFQFLVEDVGWANQSQAQIDARAAARAFYLHSLQNGVILGRPPVDESSSGRTIDPDGRDSGISESDLPI